MLTLKQNYNLELKLRYWDHLDVNLKCVISEDGNTIHTFGLWSDLECYKWQSEDDLKHLAEDRDPALEPTCHYNPLTFSALNFFPHVFIPNFNQVIQVRDV